MANIEKLIEDLSSLTILEASELVKSLEEKWGISAASFAVAGAPAAGAAAAAEEKTEFNVILAAVDATKKLDTIKVVREITGLGLKEAKDLVEAAPKTLKEGVDKKTAEDIKAKLEAIGAKIEVK